MQETKSYLPEGALMKTPACRARLRSRQTLLRAMEEGAVLEETAVSCGCGMSLNVPLPDGIRGVIRREDCCAGEVKDIAVITRVGRPVQFRILSLEGDTAYLSRRLAQEDCIRDYLSRLTPGDIIPARVTHMEPFGAFCDIGCGVISLLTVDKISVSRISHPSDRFRTGDFIDAVVASRDEYGRICLSHRELLGTWEENAAAFSAGQTVTGIVRSVEDYGIFVELTPNLAGLAEPVPGVSPGDFCSVYIKSILPERMKIKLVLIDAWREEGVRAPMRYFVDGSTPGGASCTSCTSGADGVSGVSVRRMESWRYSPAGCGRVVETVFVSRAREGEELLV